MYVGLLLLLQHNYEEVWIPIFIERIYRYFQQTEEIKDIYLLKRNFELVQLQHFRNSPLL